MTKKLHILRHGQAIHNVQRGYPLRDPPLTEQGLSEATNVVFSFQPDLIICSPMVRTIQTVSAAFPDILHSKTVPLDIWPDLREAHDAICNQGVSRSQLATQYPSLDLSLCAEEWDYSPHSEDAAVQRATRQNILLVSHRGFIAYLAGGSQFSNCCAQIELRSYTFDPEGNLIKLP
ncbi:histidine phosphatase superfamily [Mycena rebaudengoi]|nr:histidine phosphatase superfamily [Mycena rebaudengoi]